MIEGVIAEIAESTEMAEGFSNIECSITTEEADSMLEGMLNEGGFSDIKEVGDAQHPLKLDVVDPDTTLEGWLKSSEESSLNLHNTTENTVLNTESISNPGIGSNTEYSKDGVFYKTDDLGKDYIKDGELIPDNTYKKDGHLYTTDKNGNVILKDGETVNLGGSYKEVIVPGEGSKKEVHHMPSNDSTDLSLGDGPAIKMDKQDHRQTASCGNSKEAQEYREAQRELVKEGKFREAMQMDIDDIREKFGDKYDDAISEMLDYVDELEKEGKI